MSNDIFYCKTIKKNVTPATCKIRLEGGWCSLDKCFIKGGRKNETMNKDKEPKVDGRSIKSKKKKRPYKKRAPVVLDEPEVKMGAFPVNVKGVIEKMNEQITKKEQEISRIREAIKVVEVL